MPRQLCLARVAPRALRSAITGKTRAQPSGSMPRPVTQMSQKRETGVI
ncbi:MAG: hypothetical protein ACNA7L_07135 [Roseinatronobacter sp.]